MDAAGEGDSPRDVSLSADELDLAVDAGETASRDEDEELLNQRLPEDEAYHELELEEGSGATAANDGNKSIPGDEEVETAAAAERGETAGYSLPLEQQQRRGVLGSALWGGGIVLLLAGLALQYIYYHRAVLAENAGLRPLLGQMCELTGCQLPPRRDLGKIELADHLMQFHPRYEDSLLITATLVNRAEFTQPFPIVEVVMTDLQQKVIAHRHFRPEEYLIGERSGQGFTPNTEVPLMLEVADPGENAVGFEFNFY
jgi:hypothetical protein